eukprot:CAMPEP_0202827790 /NCGR_PEP_ID=MMETSP1389-20130828/14520_1 /ASSEMBLY_ACC=CAM_ASM_000865 /TAXON_ID=302021 /ORGANISM="Rhodomonas sp., Strain CCMP768" /LENGTH=162 /DNA_ID=CAMNT_0049501233 /DNA_START=61 /DNA_END=545 /DNA_ORIENTATION=+
MTGAPSAPLEIESRPAGHVKQKTDPAPVVAGPAQLGPHRASLHLPGEELCPRRRRGLLGPPRVESNLNLAWQLEPERRAAAESGRPRAQNQVGRRAERAPSVLASEHRRAFKLSLALAAVPVILGGLQVQIRPGEPVALRPPRAGVWQWLPSTGSLRWPHPG